MVTYRSEPFVSRNSRRNRPRRSSRVVVPGRLVLVMLVEVGKIRRRGSEFFLVFFPLSLSSSLGLRVYDGVCVASSLSYRWRDIDADLFRTVGNKKVRSVILDNLGYLWL